MFQCGSPGSEFSLTGFRLGDRLAAALPGPDALTAPEQPAAMPAAPAAATPRKARLENPEPEFIPPIFTLRPARLPPQPGTSAGRPAPCRNRLCPGRPRVHNPDMPPGAADSTNDPLGGRL
jgi:hypothetical protein